MGSQRDLGYTAQSGFESKIEDFGLGVGIAGCILPMGYHTGGCQNCGVPFWVP